MPSLGLMCGAGALPARMAAEARRQGWRVVAFTFPGAAALGGLAGALVGWGVPKEQALKYETQVKAGKFLVVARGKPEDVTRARGVLAPESPEHLDVYESAAL